jgi:hypothetical protein
MSRLLSGITHALVSVPTLQDAKASGTYALVDLCFGPGDDTALSGFRYSRNEDNKMMWQVPMYEVIRNGHRVLLPIFKGALLIETTKLASQSVARIKRDLGEAAWGKRYRVLKDQVLIEDLPKE